MGEEIGRLVEGRASTFDEYWERLAKRGDERHRRLEGPERVFWRLSAVRGEIYSGGIVAYFDRQFEHFEDDLLILKESSFEDVSILLSEAKGILYGDRPLTQETIDEGTSAYFEWPDDSPLYDRLNDLHELLYPRCDDIEDYRNALGLREGFYDRIE